MWKGEEMQIYAYGRKSWKTNLIGTKISKDLSNATEGALSKSI